VSKGAAITLVVKTGLVEISTKAVANDNADVGDTLPVMLRPSGKVVRAKLIAKDRALLEGTNP
jgi:flagella basal body P-ring formation protein FlgA